jgi:hypothetical protein
MSTYYPARFLCPCCVGARHFRGVICECCGGSGRDPDQQPRLRVRPVRHRKRPKPVRILNIARERESEL